MHLSKKAIRRVISLSSNVSPENVQPDIIFSKPTLVTEKDQA